MSKKITEVLFPAELQDGFTEKMREDLGFIGAKRLDNGKYAGVVRLLFTVAICMDVTECGYRKRYCFEDFSEMLHQWQRLSDLGTQIAGYVASRP